MQASPAALGRLSPRTTSRIGTRFDPAHPVHRHGVGEAYGLAWTELEPKVRAFVEDAGDTGLARVIDYRLINGQPGSTPLWHMAQHVVNHASYHRGQITTMLRQIGAAPAKPMDLIAFYRVKAGQA